MIMNSGISGRVTAMIAAETQSCPSTTASISSGMNAAITSWGRYLAKYPSRASKPCVARWIRALDEVDVSLGRTSRAVISSVRSVDFTAADARCASHEFSQLNPPRSTKMAMMAST